MSDQIRAFAPQFLWMMVALMMVGVGRPWLCAGRGRVHDDPIIFIAQDRVCLALLAAAVIVVALAV